MFSIFAIYLPNATDPKYKHKRNPRMNGSKRKNINHI